MQDPTLPPCPRCFRPHSNATATECPACGETYPLARSLSIPAPGSRPRPVAPPNPAWRPPPLDAPPEGGFLTELLLHVPDAVNPVMLGGRAVFLALLMLWGTYFISLDWHTNQIGASFMHTLNLVFHEAGHVIFAVFGSRFITFLGGSLNQLLVPAIFGFVFLLKYRNPFGAAVCLGWFGQSLMDLAPYIGDARIMDLPLLGDMDESDVDTRGERHDWHNILGQLDLLKHDTQFASLTHHLGSACVVVAGVWGALVLWRQYQRRSELAFEEDG